MKEIIKNILKIIGFITLCVISFLMISWAFAVMVIPLIVFTIILIPCLFYFFKVKYKFQKSEILKYKYLNIYLALLTISTLCGYYLLYRVWPAIMGI
jgi:membrane protein YdbS with pleckstrin-like domain